MAASDYTKAGRQAVAEARELEQARRRARLPQWAQQELARLESSVADLKRKLTAGPEDSDTFVDHMGHMERTPLGQRPRVTFHLDEEGARSNGWNAHHSVEAHVLEVRGRRVLALTGTPGLCVWSRSSNQLWVTTDEAP